MPFIYKRLDAFCRFSSEAIYVNLMVIAQMALCNIYMWMHCMGLIIMVKKPKRYVSWSINRFLDFLTTDSTYSVGSKYYFPLNGKARREIG